MQKGKIKNIKIFAEKGKPGEIAQSVQCIADYGLEGDRFAKGGEKQLTMIDDICESWLCRQDVQGLCFKRYKANITVENFDLSTLKTGEKLLCGDAVLEISQESKDCFEECTRVQNKMDCMLKKHAKYLKVAKSGKIRTDNEITKIE